MSGEVVRSGAQGSRNRRAIGPMWWKRPLDLVGAPPVALSCLLLGFLVALLVERLNDRIRDCAQLADATGTQLVLEMSKGGGGSNPQRLEQEAASYALAHASLVARKEGVRSVLVVAATLGDPVADVGVSLARDAADLGERVLVIQADRRSVGQEAVPRSFGPGRASQVVVEATEAHDDGKQGNLPAPDGLDLIVSCTPLPGYSSDAMAVVSTTDVAVVVATRGRTRFQDARWTAELLRHTGVRVSGAILLGRNGSRRRPPARLAPLTGPDQDSGLPGAPEPGDRQDAGPSRAGQIGHPLRRQVMANSAARDS